MSEYFCERCGVYHETPADCPEASDSLALWLQRAVESNTNLAEKFDTMASSITGLCAAVVRLSHIMATLVETQRDALQGDGEEMGNEAPGADDAGPTPEIRGSLSSCRPPS